VKQLGGRRQKAAKVKTAKGRSTSSQKWLARQLNDPYVAEAKRQGWRSRAAFKLADLDDRFHLLKKGRRVLDLGAAPGGWTQVAVERTGGRVLAVDLLEMAPIAGAEILLLDFLDSAAPGQIRAALGGPVDVVLSDMAAPTTGHAATDHIRTVGLAEAALAFALEVLAPGGAFVCKVFQGGAEKETLARLKQRFAQVRHAKPPSSRKESPETYLVAQGFRDAP
jgi:23S rRNA (uridine2552-2'-O)-methyltransferase